jgi:hypothetical protein
MFRPRSLKSYLGIKTKEKISVDEGFVKAVGEEKMLPPPPGKIRSTDLPSKIS